MRRRYGSVLLVLMLLMTAASGTMAADHAMNFKDADMRDVLRTLGELAGVNVAADPQVQGRVTMYLQGMDALEALELIVRVHGYDMLQRGSTVIIGPRATLFERFASTEPVFDFRDTALRDVFHDLAKQGGYSLLLETPLEGTLTILLQGVDVDEAIRLAARQSGVRYRFEGNSLIVGTRPALGSEPAVSPEPTVDGELIVRPEPVVDTEPVGGTDPVVRVEREPDGGTDAIAEGVDPVSGTIRFREADLRDVLFQLGDLAEVGVVADPQVQGRVTAVLQGMEPMAALELIVQTNGYTFFKVGDTVVVGPESTLMDRFEPVRTEFFPVRYVEPGTITSALQIVAPSATIQADPSLRGVLVRGTEEDLWLITQFLRDRDVERQLEMDFRDADLLDVFHTLAKRGGYSLLLETPLHGSLTILLQGIDVDEAIRLAARESQVDYRFEGNSLIVKMDPPVESAKPESPEPRTDTEQPMATTSAPAPRGEEPVGTEDRLAPQEPALPMESREARVLPTYYIDGTILARLLVTGGAIDGDHIDTVDKALLVRATDEERDQIQALLARYDVPTVRLDGIVRGPKARMAVLSVAGRTHVVAEGTYVEGLFVESIGEHDVTLRTAHDYKMHVPIGGRE